MSDTFRQFGAYTILEGIAEGGMAHVHKAEDQTHNLVVALKVLKPEADEAIRRHQAVGQALWEGDIAIQLDHRNVIRTYERGVERGRHYIAMELLDAFTLKYLIFAGSPLVAHHRAAFVMRIAEGLAYIHGKGFIHRDVSPKNILVDADNQPKLIDFGLSVPIASARHRRDLRSGSASYMAPEQHAAAGLDVRSDVYAFGMTMHEILAGYVPLHPDGSPATQPPDAQSIPEELDAIVARAIKPKPEDRFASMDDLCAALRAALPTSAFEAPAQDRVEARRFPRVEEACFVTFRIDAPAASAVEYRTVTKNISLVGACCIKLAEPLPEGGRLAMALLLPGDSTPMNLHAEVVWASRAEQGKGYEMGLRFTGLTAKHRDMIRAFVLRRVRRNG